MNGEDLFGVFVRLAGLAFFVFVLFDLLHAAREVIGIPIPSRYPVSADLLAAVVWLILAGISFAGADAITRLAYRRGQSST